MTNTLKRAIEELQKHPADVQESWGARILAGLGITPQKPHEGERGARPYSSLDVLLDAGLSGPKDASVTYEDVLSGIQGDEK